MVSGIFLFCDVVVVLGCWLAYREPLTYRQGMVLGVHIPANALDHPEVAALLGRARRQWRWFQGINMALGAAVCLLPPAVRGGDAFAVMMLAWCVWLVEYIAGMQYLINVPHRRLYRIKVQNGWVNPATRHTVYADTKLSAAGGRLAPPWQWQLVYVGAAALAAAVSADRWPGAWPLMAAGMVGSALLFLLLHRWLARRMTVYSADEAVNLAANRAMARGWAVGLLWAGGLSAAGWCWLAAQPILARWGGWAWMPLHLALQLAGPLALLWALWRANRQRQAVLEADAAPLETDDDEYWQTGSYRNPRDARLLVPNRLCSTNFVLNKAHPAAKWLNGICMVVLLGAAVLLAAVLLPLVNYRARLTVENGRARFSGGGYRCEFALSDVESAALLPGIPQVSLYRTNGADAGDLLVGCFTGAGGKYRLFLTRDVSPVLQVTLADGTTVLANSPEEGRTERWLRELQGEPAQP